MGGLRRLYLTYEFFIAIIAIAVLFVFGFVYSAVFLVAQGALALFIALCILEIFILYVKKHPVKAKRKVMNPLSVGDDNKVVLEVSNHYNFPIRMVIMIILRINCN